MTKQAVCSYGCSCRKGEAPEGTVTRIIFP